MWKIVDSFQCDTRNNKAMGFGSCGYIGDP